jgi:hypothetical protein
LYSLRKEELLDREVRELHDADRCDVYKAEANPGDSHRRVCFDAILFESRACIAGKTNGKNLGELLDMERAK